MSLPITARVVTIVVMRPTRIDSEVDDWNRPVSQGDDSDPPEVLRTIGDLQPVRRVGSERPSTREGSVTTSSHIAFTDVVDARTGDQLRLDPDDGLRYNIIEVSRPGIGRRLDHLELHLILVTSGVAPVVAAV